MPVFVGSLLLDPYFMRDGNNKLVLRNGGSIKETYESTSNLNSSHTDSTLHFLQPTNVLNHQLNSARGKSTTRLAIKIKEPEKLALTSSRNGCNTGRQSTILKSPKTVKSQPSSMVKSSLGSSSLMLKVFFDWHSHYMKQ